MSSMSGYSPGFDYSQSGISSAAYGIGSSINNLGNKIIKLSQGGWIDTFVRILTLFVSIYIIVVSSTNIAAYAYILRRDKEDPDISKTWCTALIVLNSLILVAALLIMVFTIIDFFKKGSKTKNIATTAVQMNTLAAIEAVGQVLNNAESTVQTYTSAGKDINEAKAAGYDSIKNEYRDQVKKLIPYQGAINFDVSQYSAPVPAPAYTPDILKVAAAIAAASK